MKQYKPILLLILALGIVWLGWMAVERLLIIPAQRVERTVNAHMALQASVEQNFGGSGYYAANGEDMLASLSARGLIDPFLPIGDEPEIPQWRVFDYWQGRVTSITALKDGEIWRITYQRVPRDACRKLLAAITGRQGGPMQGVAGSVTAIEPAYLPPLDSTIADALCRQPANELAWFYK